MSGRCQSSSQQIVSIAPQRREQLCAVQKLVAAMTKLAHRVAHEGGKVIVIVDNGYSH